MKIKPLLKGTLIILVACTPIAWYADWSSCALDVTAWQSRCQADEIIVYLKGSLNDNQTFEHALADTDAMLSHVERNCGKKPPIKDGQLLNPYGNPIKLVNTQDSILLCSNTRKKRWFHRYFDRYSTPSEIALKIDKDKTISDATECAQLVESSAR